LGLVGRAASAALEHVLNLEVREVTGAVDDDQLQVLQALDDRGEASRKARGRSPYFERSLLTVES
jgi:hypothetical protein